MDFSEFSAWSFIFILTILLASLLFSGILKRFLPFLQMSLIPSSVLGGIILLLISTVVYFAAGDYLFNFNVFNPSEGTYDGMGILELITYHCLGIGFIAMGMRGSKRKLTKARTGEVFNTGLITVSTYLIQAILGIAVTLVAVYVFHITGLIDASGILLAFGFGQGTGQALNYGTIYEEYGLDGGGNFGLTIAAMGFLVACIAGVVYLNVLRRKGIVKVVPEEQKQTLSDYEDENEIPVVASLDKFTVQVAIVLVLYAVSFVVMWGLSALIPSLKSVLFGFNFLIGVLLTLPVKAVLNKLERNKVIQKKVVNDFMMNRIGGFAFDVMIVAGIAAIKLPLLKEHWGVILTLAALGGLGTFFYLFYTSKYLFGSYRHEQFLGMFGMLTGTASTGMILLREIDGSYRSPASENLVYQNVPAIVFGLPMMFLAAYACQGTAQCFTVLGIAAVYLAVLNLILFRSKLFRRNAAVPPSDADVSQEKERTES